MSKRIAYQKRVVLAFRTSAERAHFMGQLSDGWGENYCSVTRRKTQTLETVYEVELSSDELDEMERHRIISKHYRGDKLTTRELARLKELDGES